MSFKAEDFAGIREEIDEDCLKQLIENIDNNILYENICGYYSTDIALETNIVNRVASEYITRGFVCEKFAVPYINRTGLRIFWNKGR